jgi:hypothetical protein
MFVRLKHCLAALNIVWPSQTMFGSKKQCLGAFFIVWDGQTMSEAAKQCLKRPNIVSGDFGRQ